MIVLSALVTLAAVAPPPPTGADSLQWVRVETELGTVVLEVELARAPITATNFLRYVDAGLYDGGTFYRTVREDNQPDDSVRIAVIQGGADADRPGFEPFPPIPMESTDRTGLRHGDGCLSMARGAPDSATHAFFICVGDQPELDHRGRRNPDGHGFAAFGRVVEGMEVVHRIHRMPVEAQRLVEPVRILRMERIGAP